MKSIYQQNEQQVACSFNVSAGANARFFMQYEFRKDATRLNFPKGNGKKEAGMENGVEMVEEEEEEATRKKKRTSQKCYTLVTPIHNCPKDHLKRKTEDMTRKIPNTFAG